jgi:dienelactone hydrolase
VAAVEALRQRKHIDRSRVGLWGHSQGGWLALVAASKSASVAFVIDHSGMLVPAWRQELYRLAAEAEADSVPRGDISAALAFEEEMFEVGRSGAGWDSLAAKMRENSAASWMNLVYRPESLAELREIWLRDFSFDPRPYGGHVRQPVLALFGGLDKSTPIESAANLANAMKQSPNLSISFFPTANHAFLDAVTGGNTEIPRLSRFAPMMFDVMSAWLGRFRAPPRF